MEIDGTQPEHGNIENVPSVTERHRVATSKLRPHIGGASALASRSHRMINAKITCAGPGARSECIDSACARAEPTVRSHDVRARGDCDPVEKPVATGRLQAPDVHARMPRRLRPPRRYDGCPRVGSLSALLGGSPLSDSAQSPSASPRALCVETPPPRVPWSGFRSPSIFKPPFRVDAHDQHFGSVWARGISVARDAWRQVAGGSSAAPSKC